MQPALALKAHLAAARPILLVAPLAKATTDSHCLSMHNIYGLAPSLQQQATLAAEIFG